MLTEVGKDIAEAGHTPAVVLLVVLVVVVVVVVTRQSAETEGLRCEV